MSLRPRALAQIPKQTAAAAHAAFPKGSPAMLVRDELGEVFNDAAFVDALSGRRFSTCRARNVGSATLPAYIR